jgi:hypothetical protein
MASNGKRKPPRPRIEMGTATVTAEEAAAIAAALERFLSESAQTPALRKEISRWQRAALEGGVRREPHAESWGARF